MSNSRASGSRSRGGSVVQDKEVEDPMDPISSENASERQRSTGAVSAALPQRETRRDSRSREESLLKVYEEQELELAKTRAQLEAERAQLELERAAKNEINKEWKLATADLNRLHAERNHNHKIDDDYLKIIWGELRYQIKDWAFEHFDGELKSSNVFRVGPSEELAHLAQDVKYWLRSPKARPLVAQALVWYVLQHRVFEVTGHNNGLVWAGLESWKLRAMRMVLRPSSSTTPYCVCVIANSCRNCAWIWFCRRR